MNVPMYEGEKLAKWLKFLRNHNGTARTGVDVCYKAVGKPVQIEWLRNIMGFFPPWSGRDCVEKGEMDKIAGVCKTWWNEAGT
jgi:hypothetical protein